MAPNGRPSSVLVMTSCPVSALGSGAPPAPGPGAVFSPGAPPAPSPTTPAAARLVEISRTGMIGRAPDNDFVLSDPLVSAHHARIEWNDDGVLITDLGSTNHLESLTRPPSPR